MGVTPTGSTPSAVYTKKSALEKLLPPNAISATSIITDAILTTIIGDKSREVDARLWPMGFETPFPDIDAASPLAKPPYYAQEIARMLVVAECRDRLAAGNRKMSGSKYWERAEALFEKLRETPSMMGFGLVSSPEDFTQTASSGSVQYGRLQGPYFRLRNRNVRAGSIRFVKSTGVEAFHSVGFGFDEGRDWEVVDYAESVLAIWNEATIISAIGSGGGVVYEFDWRRLSFGQSHTTPMSGVNRI